MISSSQMGLDVPSILQQRGFRVGRCGREKLSNTVHWANEINSMDLLNAYSDRKWRSETRNCLRENGYFILKGSKYSRDRDGRSLGERHYTAGFEHFVAHVFREEFCYRSSEWGIEINDAPYGGDFDVVAINYSDTIFIECKAGLNWNNKETYKNFIQRSRFINSTISIFLVDYCGFEKFICFNQVIDSYDDVAGCNVGDLVKISPKNDSSLRVYAIGWEPIFFLDSNNSDRNIVRNLRFVLKCVHSLRHIRYVEDGTHFSELKKYFIPFAVESVL